MSGTVNYVEPVGRIGGAYTGDYRKVKVECRRILVVMIIAHGGVGLGTVKTDSFCYYSIPVPDAITISAEGAACQRIGRTSPGYTIAVVE